MTSPPPPARWTECVLCDGTGSLPDADHPCGSCGGLGEIEYVPVAIQRCDEHGR